jgi:pyruvate kinase
VLVPDFTNTDEMLEKTAEAMLRYNLNLGDKLVITAGVPFGQQGQTNLIQVHEIT